MIRNLQALRALAALMVVFVHCQLALAPLGFPDGLRAALNSGVDLFFVISGFVMAYTTSRSPSSPGEFIKNRIIRVVPLYWILTLSVFLIAQIAPDLLQSTDGNAIDLIKSLLFVPYARADGAIVPILFVGWSLNYEMFFYIVFAISIFVADPVRRVAYSSIFLVSLIIFGYIFGYLLPNEIRFYTYPLIVDFVLGMYIGLWWSNWAAVPTRSTIRMAALCVPALLVLLVVGGALNSTALPAAAVPAAGLVVVALLLERGGYQVKSSWVLEIGAASYSLYLLHPFVAQAITKLGTRLGVLNAQTGIVFVALIYVAACVAAVACFRLVERPITEFLRAAAKRRAPRPA